jgi:hypothetical protein
MGSQIDYIGSLVVNGLVILLVLTLNSNVATTSFQRTRDLSSQQSATTMMEILESDLFLAGYRSDDVPFLQADSTAIRFTADLDDNGVVDTVAYVLGTPSENGLTPNLRDRPLRRRVNSTLPYDIAQGLVEFTFAYFDTGGHRMVYDSLKAASHRALIRLLEIRFRVEPSDPLDTTYIPVEVRRTIRPRNVGGW